MNPTENQNPKKTPEEIISDLSENKSPTPSQVIEMPSPELGQKGEPPKEAPKVSVAPPNPPKAPQQKSISVALQMEAIAQKICKVRGHTLEGVVLRTTQMVKDLGAIPFENTIVICKVCGASLAQIRG